MDILSKVSFLPDVEAEPDITKKDLEDLKCEILEIQNKQNEETLQKIADLREELRPKIDKLKERFDDFKSQYADFNLKYTQKI
jgi:predicted  nucleic acid-binding Zn-ribbon protein